jgi:hypothetical protein
MGAKFRLTMFEQHESRVTGYEGSRFLIRSVDGTSQIRVRMCSRLDNKILIGMRLFSLNRIYFKYLYNALCLIASLFGK